MRGRLAGSPENRVASAFIKSRFERSGLIPAGPGGSFYQYFNVARTAVGENNRLRVIFDQGETSWSLAVRPLRPARVSLR